MSKRRDLRSAWRSLRADRDKQWMAKINHRQVRNSLKLFNI